MKGSASNLFILFALAAALVYPRTAAAHCDTVNGPVVSSAKVALNLGDVTPVLKWIRPEDEAEVRQAFKRALKVRGLDAAARDLADTYFFETLVRVHRAGEGQPFNGLKEENGVEPGIALADKALDSGSGDELVKQVTAEIESGLRKRFLKVQEARKHADHNVAAGRAYVAAYVDYIHYVERVHQAINTQGVHAEHAHTASSRE